MIERIFKLIGPKYKKMLIKTHNKAMIKRLENLSHTCLNMDICVWVQVRDSMPRTEPNQERILEE